MALRFIAIDPETNGNDCPTLWADDEAGDYVIKGWAVTASFSPRLGRTRGRL